MQYILTTTSEFYPVIEPRCDGTFQILLESTLPFEFETGPAHIPGLRFGKKLDFHWVEYAGKERRTQPLDWYILKFFNEHRKGEVPQIVAYLESKGYKTDNVNFASETSRYGTKQIKWRIDEVLRFLECPAKVMRKKGGILEVVFYGK